MYRWLKSFSISTCRNVDSIDVHTDIIVRLFVIVRVHFRRLNGSGRWRFPRLFHDRRWLRVEDERVGCT